MRACIALLTTVSLLLAVPAAGAAGFIPSYTAHYSLSRGAFTLAESKFTLQREADGKLRYHSEAEPRGLARLFFSDNSISETSVFRLHDGRIQALSYQFVHHNGDKADRRSVRFDWENDTAVSRKDGKTRHLKVPPGTVDQMVLQLAVMRDLADGRDEMSYKLVSDNELKTYHFAVKGRERVHTSAGTFYTLRVERTRDPDKTTVFWCAPKLDYLPVKMLQQKKGGAAIRLELESIQGLPAS
ncbi:MAG TPA: DUF3108 domain-containing protein [Gammaproteobacteria bacterium]|nr:DUF3108 domain-containing protein [Gammaproteobacteria bacterium]